jgi:DNA-3-methyladenine glycosylase II
LRELEKLDDAEVRERLIAIKGIGRWTAEIYLLMILGRPDAWPVGDIALVRAVREVKSLEADPDAAELEQVAQVWRPWRSVAARVLWLHYLNR